MTVPKIVCLECGKTDKTVCDPDWTMKVIGGVILSSKCKVCNGGLLFVSMLPNVVVIAKEMEKQE